MTLKFILYILTAKKQTSCNRMQLIETKSVNRHTTAYLLKYVNKITDQN